MVAWEDRLLESIGRLGSIVVVVNEGAEGWRVHLSAARFVIAPRGAPLAEAKTAAEEIVAGAVSVAVLAERERCAKVADAYASPEGDAYDVSRAIAEDIRVTG